MSKTYHNEGNRFRSRVESNDSRFRSRVKPKRSRFRSRVVVGLGRGTLFNVIFILSYPQKEVNLTIFLTIRW